MLKVRKFLSIILVFSIAFISCFNIASTTVFASDNDQVVTVDGYDFVVLKNNIEGVTLQYIDEIEDSVYIFNLDRQSFEKEAMVNIVSNTINPLTRSVVSENYGIKFDENIKYTPNGNISEIEIIDSQTNDSYVLDENQRFAFLIPIGIPLLYAALEALLVAGAVIIVGGFAYTLAEEIAQELRRQDEYKYYIALLESGSVWIGAGLTTPEAKSLICTHQSNGTVMAVSFNYARGLTGGFFDGPEEHGCTSGYWSHIHAKTGSIRYKAHLWFL